MLQTIIDIANMVSPFLVCAFVLYVCCGWILVYFKRDTLVSKYFTDDWDARFSSVLFLVMAVGCLILQACVKVPENELSPLGFISLMCVGMYVVIGGLYLLVTTLKKYRDTITPQ